MSCQICGMQNCQGFCRQSIMGGQAQAQMANQYAHIQGQLAAQQYQLSKQLSTPTPEEKFMELIDGKSDEEIVLAFEMLVAAEDKQQEELIRRLQENYVTSQQAKKDSFLSMCKDS